MKGRWRAPSAFLLPGRTMKSSRETIALEDGNISFLRWPAPEADAPRLIFLHANGFNANTYRRILEPLATRFEIIAPDQRGHGFTELPADPRHHPGWIIYSHDLIAFAARLPARQTILAGHSMGSVAALHALARQPELGCGLLLAEPVVIPRLLAWAMGAHRRLGVGGHVMPVARAAARRRAHWPDIDSMVRAYTGRGAFRTWPVEIIRDYAEGGLTAEEGGGYRLACAPAWEAANFSTYTPVLWPALRALDVPVTLMHGTHRSTCPPLMARRVMRVLKNGRRVAIEGASHFLPMEHPDRLRAEIDALAGRCLKAR
jgi:pimeloyl-ACP methyl ester carboxylesterase